MDVGIDLTCVGRVLDFGCGCGRTTRWFIDKGGTTEFHGADVDKEAIGWCRTHLTRGHFIANTPNPPLPYPDEYFDAVYCLSVFTHLNEEMQNAWIEELFRVTKPGGAVLLTVYGVERLKDLDPEGKKTVREKGFLHRRSRKLKGLVPEWYHTSWHSREYVLKRLLGSFADARYFEVADGLQDVVIATKEA